MSASAHDSFDERAYARELLRQMVEVDTTAANGTRVLAELLAGRMRAEGFEGDDVRLVVPDDQPSRANLIVRLHGSGRAEPLLIIGHLDVVEAVRANWSVEPFRLTQKDGFYYGRGVLDMKGEDAAALTALVRMKRGHFVPDRDILVALTADEEAGTGNGIKWLLQAHRQYLHAGLAINPDEGAAGIRAGKHVYYGVQTSTKRYVTYVLESSGKSGHTAIPQPDNAIYKLAAALVRVGNLKFPIELDPTTKAYFGRTAALETGQTRADMLAVDRAMPDLSAADRLAANPERNANLRTTCVATLLQAGTVENALADEARATVQCRLLPGDAPSEVQRALIAAIADAAIRITMTEGGEPNPASPLDHRLMGRIERAVHSLWPGLLVLPTLNIGASDSVYTRAAGIPTYGLCSIFYDLDDDRAHADDERIGVDNFYDGVKFMHRLLTELSAAYAPAN